MNFRYLFLLLVGLLFLTTSVQGQTSLKKGDRYFDLFMFEKAIKQYKRVLEKDGDNYQAIRRLADCYRLTADTKESEFWYDVATEHTEAEPIVFYYHAQALKSNEKYDEAQRQFLQYGKLAPEDKRGNRLALGIELIADLKKDSLKYSILHLDINTPVADFSPMYYKDSSLVFVSARGDSRRTDNWSGDAFLDLYFADITDTGLTEPKPLQGKINNRYHEGPVTFSDDDGTMYFTRNNYVKRKKGLSDENIMNLNIYKTVPEGSEWDAVIDMPFNSDDHSVGHPTLTKDGKTMYFSSDMPDGYGGLDLYKVEYKDSAWTEPENLGPGINTMGDEAFPFIHEDGTLYFSSDSYEGLGGLDVYSASNESGAWRNIQNLGYPLNSSSDDFGIIWNEDKTQGYFSSNRAGGTGDDDIYWFDTKGLNLRTMVYDKLTGNPIDSATVYLILDEDTLMHKLTNTEGRTNFMVEIDKEYTLSAKKSGYNPNSLDVNTEGMDNSSPEVRIPLGRGELLLEGFVYDVNTGDRIPKALVTLYNDQTQETDSVEANSNGEFAFELVTGVNYTLAGDKDGYFLQTEKTISTFDIPEGETTIKDSLAMSDLRTGTVVKLENIYFDFDKYNIREPDATKELNRVYDLMVKYPDLVIQMRSHTDARATHAYNMWLSARRAESSANYILSRGLGYHRITAAGFGENQPVNECVDNVECSEEKHQDNRRTEFKVIQQPKGIYIGSSVDE